MSGYTECACRDCMEVAIGNNEPGGAYCWACAESDCTRDSDCNAPHTYCPADSRYTTDTEWCEVCGQAW